MSKQGKFGLFETTALATLVIVSKIFYTSLGVVVKSTGTAAWYGALMACTLSIIFFLIIYLLMRRFPGMDVVEIFEAVMGKFTGRVMGFLYACYLIFYAATSSREFFEVIKTYVLPNTKDSIIYISFIGVIVLIAYKGLESLVRLSYISFFPILGGLLLILILAYPYYNPGYLKPYLGYGLKNTLTYWLPRCAVYEEVLTLIIIVKSIHGMDNFLKAGLTGLILSGIIFSLSAVSYIMMFTYVFGAENLSGMFHMSRTVYFSRFFQRMETIFLFPWVVSSLITAGAACYLSLYVYCASFKINNYKPLIFPFSFLIYMIAVIPKNITDFIQNYLPIVRQYSAINNYGIPILVFLVAVITGKRGEKQSVKKN